MTLLIEKVKVGRKSGSSCVKPSRKNRKAKRCALYKRAGALSRNGLKGQNEVPFSGRIGSRKLTPGKYRVGISSTNAAGTGNPQFASFTVLPPGNAKGLTK